MPEKSPGERGISRREALTGAVVLGSAPVLLGAAGGVGTAAAETPDAGGAHGRVSADMRRMLAEISAANIERTILKLVSFGTRSTLSSQTDPTRGVGAARDWLLDQFQQVAAASGGRMTVQAQSFVQPVGSRIPVPTPITNIVATLAGSQPESAGRTYVVSGHYDSMCTDVLNFTNDAPGANDDASGVAAVLEMARVMSKRRFDATLVFMAVAGEEQGLYGSAYYAAQAKAAGANVAGMFTNDIIGSSHGQNGEHDPFSVRLFAEGLPTTPSPLEADFRRFGGAETELAARQLGRYIKEVAENEATRMKVNLIYFRDRHGRGGDHIPFLQQGYAAVRFTEPHEDYRHQHQDVRVQDGVQWGDLPEFVDYTYIARVARVNACALACLAMAPASPAGALINPASFTNDTALSWTANTEPDLAGYEVVLRATTDPEWTDTVEVGNVTSHTLENVSKDNYFFGVRAVDTAGNRSPVSYPRPST